MSQKLIQFINLTKHSYLYRISMHHPCRLQKLPDSRAQHMITVVEGIKLKKIDLKRKISFAVENMRQLAEKYNITILIFKDMFF